jgi:hypothetical protein
MKRFDATFQDFRKIGEARDVADRHSFFAEQLGRSASGNYVDALLLQRARERGDAFLVGDGNECAGDFQG